VKQADFRIFRVFSGVEMAKTRSGENGFVIDFKAILCKMRFEYPIQYNKD